SVDVNGDAYIDRDAGINGSVVIQDNISVNGVSNLEGVVNADRRISFANSFDSNGVIDNDGDYKLKLFSGDSPANSYGFGIQSNTLFANSFGEYDFKIGGVDRFNLTATDATFNTNISATGNVNINQGLSVGGDLAMTGRLLVSTDTNDSGFPSAGSVRLPSNYEPGTTFCRTVGNRRRVVVGARLVVISSDQLAIQLVCAD
ncbi:MAG: hypothetical protein AAFX99_12575, partial [Myxococcota bacterium]